MSVEFSSFEGIARLFPLPNVVLFPEALLPLHMFEPRYLQMTAEALADDRLIAMVLLKPGLEGQYRQRPPIHPVGCVGKIVAEEAFEDGTYDILLRGLFRVRILGEVENDKLYRSAQVQELEDEVWLTSTEEMARLGQRLNQVISVWFRHKPRAAEELVKLIKIGFAFGAV